MQLVFPLVALLSWAAVIGAQQSPPLPTPAALDDLDVAEQDFVSPLGRDAFRNSPFAELFEQFGAGRAISEPAYAGGFFGSPFYRSYARFLYSLFRPRTNLSQHDFNPYHRAPNADRQPANPPL